MQLKDINSLKIVTNSEGKSKHLRNRFVEEEVILKTICILYSFVVFVISPHIEVAIVDVTSQVIVPGLKVVIDHHTPLLVNVSHFLEL